MITFGIDPGKGGGVAVIVDDKLTVIPMPVAGDEIDVGRLSDWIGHFGGGFTHTKVWIEKVGPMPKQGVVSTFDFGFNLGLVHATVRMLGQPLFLVRPQVWKRVILSGTDKSKQAAIDYVTRRWPGVSFYEKSTSRVCHDGMAEAACIAEFGMYYLSGPM